MNTMRLSPIAIWLSVILCSSALWWGCKKNAADDNGPSQTQFKIISGACGSAVFQEKIGADFQTAYSELERRKSDYFSRSCPNIPCNEVELESYEIGVADNNDVNPGEQFFAVRVLDKNSKMLLHSVSEVITSSGNLYQISWCPD